MPRDHDIGEARQKAPTRAVIVGAGGHAAALDDYIRQSNKTSGEPLWEIVGYLDDNEESHGRYKFSGPWLGRVEGHEALPDVGYVMAIGDPSARRAIAERLAEQGARFPNFVHSSAYVSESAVIGEGVVIAPNVTVGPNVVVGDFCFLNARCSLGHDAVLGRYNTIGPNVGFSGFTVVGAENFFGINSATLPEVRVGDRNKIAAGMVLDRDVGDSSTVFYRYKERVVAVRGW